MSIYLGRTVYSNSYILVGEVNKYLLIEFIRIDYIGSSNLSTAKFEHSASIHRPTDNNSTLHILLGDLSFGVILL